jgi:hypothetical protein
MSRAQIFLTYILIDLAIVGIAVWCYFHRIPVRWYFVPVIVLFVVNGIWLTWATITNMPQKPGS